MFEAVMIMLGCGAVCGAVLSIASKVFYVYEDPRIAEIEGALAGANCGGCGYAGCPAAAAAVVAGKAPANVCVISGPEGIAQVAEIMGMDPGTAEPFLSVNACDGGDRATDKYDYMGVQSCSAISKMYGGKRDCVVGCLGYGDCVRSCKFDAIHMGPNGYPVVDEIKCVGCGACENACPKSIITVRTMSQRLLTLNAWDQALAPCQQTCPAEIDIPTYIQKIREGDYEGAVATLKERNPLIVSIGRVCPHPCEDYCRRGVEEEPVSINQLKRFVADYEMNSGRRFPIPCAPATGKKVAVIGGGPAGLSAAFFLRRLGYGVTVLEAMPKLGGMLRYGIPEYRLPKKALDWEIEGILNLGVEVRTNVRMGRDFDMGTLAYEGFDAIFLGIGAWSDYTLRIEGEELNGCFTGINFLSRFADGEKLKIGKRPVVVGGGNTAIDCVRTLVRLGADEVTLLYRRTRKEMPANEVEIEAAEHEGVKYHFLAAPTRVVGDAEGNATHLEFLKMELGEPDASGRRRPVPIEGSETLLEADMIISAIGQRPDITFKEGRASAEMLDITRWNTIDNEPITLKTSMPQVFTAGDAATGASLVVEAIGGARRAVRSIHQYLSGEPVEAPANVLFKEHIPQSLWDHVPGLKKTKRCKMPELPVEERIKTFEEVDLVIDEETAHRESERCLNCCRLCYNPDIVEDMAA